MTTTAPQPGELAAGEEMDVVLVAPQVRDRRRAPAPRRPRPARAPLGDARLTALIAVVVVAGLAGWLVLQLVALGALSQARAQDVEHATLREQLAGQTAPLGTVDPGDPVALLTIPTLGLQQVVVEGTASSDLQAGPGHKRDTVLPGQLGVSVVYGKSLTYGAPFRSIVGLTTGDGIQVVTAQGTFTYRVDRVRRAGDALPALAAGGSRLTLVTTQTRFLMPDEVVYVDATLTSPGVVGTGRVTAVPASEKAMGVDTSGLPLLALGLAALLAAVVGVVLAYRRLATAVVWVIGAPVVLACLWLVGVQVGQLLPNLL